jgi:hypothetical protein
MSKNGIIVLDTQVNE